MEPGDGFLKSLRRDRSEDPAKLTNIPTTRYPRLFGAHLKNSGILIVHPAPKFPGRCASIGVRNGALASRNNIVLDISDEEK
jgi:hypothetical protein